MSINATRWKIGWSPKLVTLSLLIAGGIVGAMVDYPGQFAVLGLVAGVAVWFWGRSEVNANYVTLLEDFRDSSRANVERETGGMGVSSAHSFISASGSSPPLIEPARTYSTSHLLFGDTSVVVNRQYEYDMKERTQLKGGKQQEVFYDQISNVQSEDYNNYAELEVSLSSGDTERIRGRDTAGINRVKSDLQQKMREARRGTRRTQEPRAPERTQEPRAPERTQERGAPASTSADAGGPGRGRTRPSESASGEATSDAGASAETSSASAESDPRSSTRESDSDPVSTDWLAGGSSSPELRVRNDAGEPESVRVGCRVDGEKRLADDVRLAPGETADWDDLPDDSRFEIGVVVDGGPSAGERFDPERDPSGEIQVSITDSEVVFGDRADTEASRDAGSRTETTPRVDPSATSGGASTASQSTEDAASGTVAQSSSAASKVFGESGRAESGGDGESGGVAGDGGESGGVAGGGSGGVAGGGGEAASADAATESWDDAAELAAAVQQSVSRERVERLTSFLDASSGDRRSAIRGLRQSVGKHPEPIAAAVPSVASLLDDDGEARQEAIVTLQRLAESHPDAVADVTDAVVERLDDENPKVRTAACRTLDEVGATAGVEKLAELADEDAHKGVQVAAFHALQSVEN